MTDAIVAGAIDAMLAGALLLLIVVALKEHRGALATVVHPAPERYATHLTYEERREIVDITFKIGDTDPASPTRETPRKLRVVPKTDEGIEDTSITDLAHGYDDPHSGILTAPDGSSTFSVGSDGGGAPTFVTVSQLGVASAKDGEGNPIPSVIKGTVDADAGPNQRFVFGEIRVTVLAADDPVIATHIEYEETAE